MLVLEYSLRCAIFKQMNFFIFLVISCCLFCTRTHSIGTTPTLNKENILPYAQRDSDVGDWRPSPQTLQTNILRKQKPERK